MTKPGTYADRYAQLRIQHAHQRDIRARGLEAAIEPYVVDQRDLPPVSVAVRERMGR